MNPFALFTALARLLTCSRYKVEGNSMLPTLTSRQYVLATRRKQLRRGQIVVLRHPRPEHRIYIKRIVGLPGESISLRDGVTYLNDRLFEEPYLKTAPTSNNRHHGEWWNGPREYFLMGDNRGDSEDSRVFGPVSADLIIGQVWLCYWPPSTWGKIN